VGWLGSAAGVVREQECKIGVGSAWKYINAHARVSGSERPPSCWCLAALTCSHLPCPSIWSLVLTMWGVMNCTWSCRRGGGQAASAASAPHMPGLTGARAWEQGGAG
jgi:hypothetical protein